MYLFLVLYVTVILLYFISWTVQYDHDKHRNRWKYTNYDVHADEADDIQEVSDVYDTDDGVTTSEVKAPPLVNLTNQDGDVPTPTTTADATIATMPGRTIRSVVIFRDDFNTLDLTNWNYEISMYGGSNGEFQVYTNDKQNIYTEKGYLYIKPTLTVDDPRFNGPNYLYSGKMDMATLFGSCTNNKHNGCTREGKDGILPPVMSGKLMSGPSLRYGEVEIRARIPTGDWLWPALWMVPKDHAYGRWPRSGEIDIMESRGNAGAVGVGTVTSTLHWGPSGKENKHSLTHGSLTTTKSWAEAFHTWKMVWTPTHIATYIDDQLIMDIDPGTNFWDLGGFDGANIWASGDKVAPFDKEFYAIFNVAVGGTKGFFPESINYGQTKPWTNDSPDAPDQFWKARDKWSKTWKGDAVALIVDYIEMRTL